MLIKKEKKTGAEDEKVITFDCRITNSFSQNHYIIPN